MRTKQEIREADKRELEIETEYKVADKAARLEFQEATKEAFAEYEAVWKPAREKWGAFSQPHFGTLRVRLATNRKTRDDALAEARSGWAKCPRCGTSAARYQTFCTNDKCGINLLTGGPGRFVDGKWIPGERSKDESRNHSPNQSSE